MSRPPLILASSSPRRRQLLAEAGYAFSVISPRASIEENLSPAEAELPARELVARLAALKAEDVASNIEQGIVIGCDTVAECQGQILGKPRDRQHAQEMLSLLRGEEHRVYSGLCLWPKPQGMPRAEVAVTKLIMHPISDAQLEQHLDSQQWQGKAGAFGFQDGLDWVHVVEGSESNVVGLPMELLAEMLASLE
jgi:septum formation protein